MYGINTRNMQTIRSYDAAKSYFERIARPPGSKWGEHERPLDGPRKPHMALVRGGNHDDEFACRLYTTDLVTYCPDGSVDVRCDKRRSSGSFMNNVLPQGLSTCVAHDRMWIQAGGRFYTSHAVLSFELKGNDWMLMNPEDIWVPDVPRIDHKLAIQVRKKLKPFEQWHNAMKRLGALKGKKLHASFYAPQYVIEELLQRPNDITLYPKLAICSSETIRTKAYKLTGAYTSVPAEPGVIPVKVAA